jgi:hypothetical protein
MARRSHARHQRPSGRAGLEAAYSALQVDLAQVRWDRYADHLELVRLGALADGLLTELQRRSTDIAALRHELQVARSTPQREDPLIAVLAAQVTDLRATVADQQRQLAEATASIQALLAAASAPPVDVATPAVAPAVEAPPTPYPATPAALDGGRHDGELAPAARVDAAVAPVAAPDRDQAPAPVLVDLVETPVLAGVGAREWSAPAPARLAPRPVPSSDVDDETVRRLRLIRESNGR